jgi:tetratricopeptide (TPR) repeat protein
MQWLVVGDGETRMVVEVGLLAKGVLAVTQSVAGSAIWALIQSRFSTTDQASLVQAVEANPGDENAKKAFEAALKDVLRADAEFAEELAALMLLVPWQVRVLPAEGATEAQLLTPYRLFTELVGREKDMGDLLAWATSDKPIAIRVLAGGAGSGKTRIALELMRLLESSADGRWHAGFLKADDIEQFAARAARANTLAVVDYAATASGQLKKWFERLADSARTDGRLRILLLEREAQRDTGWWESLTSVARSQSHERLGECFDPDGPKALRSLGETDRRELFQAMLGKAAAHLGLGSVPRLPACGENESFDTQLALQQWGEPLYLMIAAFVALMPGGPDVVGVLSLKRTVLAGEMAKHEIARLKRFASEPDEPAKAVLGLAAHATLCRGIPADNALDAATEELTSLGLHWPTGAGALADVMSDALPGPGGNIGFVEPDIVGEAFVLQALPKVHKSKQREAILRAAGRARRAAVGSVIRTIQDFSTDDVTEPMDWLEALIEAGAAGDPCILCRAADDPGLLYAIESAMPEHTLQLGEYAVEVAQLLLKRLAPESEHPGNVREKARLLDSLARRLHGVGRREESLGRAWEAVRTYEQLAGCNPEAFLPDLARSLNNLASALMDVGRNAEALERAWEAILICRQLARSNADAFLPDLAMFLHNLALMLHEVGKRDEALENASEAARIYEELARPNPDAFLPYLGGSLNSLAVRLSQVGRRDEALENASEAARIYKQLARSNPDAFLPELAMSTNNLAYMLSRLGRCDEALANASKAARVYEVLARSKPDAFLPDLASSLAVQALCLRGLKRYAEAVEAIEQALGSVRKPLEQTPAAFCGLAGGILAEYVEAAEQAGVEPDTDLVLPVSQILQSLQHPSDDVAEPES